MISPQINRHLPLPFHQMGGQMGGAPFEAMTLSLVYKEPGIISAALYRAQRQPQYGIDVIARRADGSIEVASCKCYVKIAKGNLKEWSDDFLKHWESHWEDQKVRRFILAVAADVHSKERDDEVQAERKRFESIGVEYDVWAPHQIQEKLRPHPGIVVQHLDRIHLERVCGVVSAPFQMASGAGAVPSGPSVDAFNEIKGRLSKAVGHQLDNLLARFRTGEVSHTASALQEISSGPEWDALEAGTKARVLRLQASILIQRGDVPAAVVLADQADTLEPQTEPRLRAILAFRREGVVAALEVLGEPSSQEGAHLHVAFLLEKGDHNGAAAVLDRNPAVEANHAETLRLRAFISLMQDDRATALRLADAALAAAPDSPATMQVAAFARYASALSPVLGRDQIARASPVPIDLVREDAASREHLIRALEMFEALGRKEQAPAERRDNEVFALACLCNLRDRSADAAARLQTMLSTDPGWAAAAYWGLARGLPLDRDALRDVLRSRLTNEDADPDGVLLLAGLEAADGRFDDAIRLLETSTTFKTPEALSIRDQWLTRVRRRSGLNGTDTSENVEEDDVDKILDEAKELGEWSRAEALLARLATRPGDPDFVVLSLAQALAGSARWEAIIPHTDVLLAMATPEPIRIAVYAAAYTGRHAPALEILSRFREAFPGGRLPPDLARIEVEALSGVGDQPRAIQKAVLLASTETSTIEDHVTAAVVHLRTGDVHSAMPFVEKAKRSGNLPPQQAIQLAQAISLVDGTVASALLQQALSGPLDPSLVPSAVALAFSLGLDRLAAPLLGDLVAMADQPGTGVQSFEVADLVGFLQERHKSAERVSRMHKSGEVPVHLAADRSGANLAQLYSLNDRGLTGRGNYPIMMLHGIHAAREWRCSALGDGPVHVDVTALLIADQLGLMETLERMRERIFVPPSLPLALFEMEEMLRSHQPSRLSATRTAVGLALSRDIAVTAVEGSSVEQPIGVVSNASGAGQWLLDLDREPGDTSGPESPDGAIVLNLRGLVDALLNNGAIDAHQHRAAVDDLGSAGRKSALGAPARHDQVFMADLVAIELAAAGVLERAAKIFRLSLSDAALQMMQADISRSDGLQAHGKRLASLRMRVARNLVAGTFRTLPATQGEEEEGDFRLTSRCLVELVRSPGVEGGLSWIDDRHVTGHRLCGANRVVDTTGMLEVLANAELITQPERWTALLRLREADALFLPMEAAEVVHHLLAAPIVDEDIVETPALATLRRYVATALKAATDLDVGPVRDGTGQGEIPFLLSLRRVAADTLLAIWTDKMGSVEDREVRSSWVWSSLRVDRFPDIGLPGTSPEAWRTLLVLNYAALLANGLQILVKVEASTRQGRLRAYMKWVDGIAVPPWMGADKGFTEQVAKTLAEMLTSFSKSEAGGKLGKIAKGVVRALLGRVVVEAPELFRDHLLADSALCRIAGVHRNEIIEFGGLQFDPSHLWKAAENALRGGSASVKATDGLHTLNLQLRPEPASGLALSGALKGNFNDIALGLLSRDHGIRLTTAQSIVAELGMAPVDAAVAVAEITHARKPSERMDRAVRIRGTSVVARRKHLQERIRLRESISWGDFDAPDPRSLLRYVGLFHDFETPIYQRLAHAARDLIGNFGVAEAVRRLSSLPVPFSAEVLAAVRALPEADRMNLLEEMGDTAATPLQLVHCLRLHRDLQELGMGNDQGRDNVARGLTSQWEASARLFVVLLKQFGEELQPSGPLSRGLRADEAIVAAWIHADQVTRALLSAGSDPEEAARRFQGRQTRREVARTVVFLPDYDCAAAAPASVTSEGLLFHGLGYVLGVEQPRTDALPSADILNGLRGVLSKGNQDPGMPAPWLFADREGARDDLGSWFGGRPAWLFPDTAGIAMEAARMSVASALRDLKVIQTGQARLWFVTSVLARPHLGDECRALAGRAVTDLDVHALVENDPEFGPVVLRFAAELAHASEGAAACSSLWDQLIVYAGQRAGVHGGHLYRPDDKEVVANLLEAAATLSRSDTEAEGWSRFSPMVLRLAKAWPGAVPILREVIASLATSAHPSHSDSLWKAWLDLRAMG